MPTERTRQLAFRLPEGLIERVEECSDRIRTLGLSLTRTDVVRLLLTYAIDKTDCDVRELLAARGNGGTSARKGASKSARPAAKAPANAKKSAARKRG